MTPCTITGKLRDPAGVVLTNTPFRVEPPNSILPSDDGIVLPAVLSETSDGSGDVSFTILPGVYRLVWIAAGRVPYTAALTVPDAPVADLQDCING